MNVNIGGRTFHYSENDIAEDPKEITCALAISTLDNFIYDKKTQKLPKSVPRKILKRMAYSGKSELGEKYSEMIGLMGVALDSVSQHCDYPQFDPYIDDMKYEFRRIQRELESL